MSILPFTALLLAESSLPEVAQPFLGGVVQLSHLFYLFAFLAAIALLWWSVALWQWKTRPAPLSAEHLDPLIQQLSRAHSLTPGELSLIFSQSERQKLSDPAALFIDPRLWGSDLMNRSPEHRLCLKLFGERVLEAASFSEPAQTFS